MQILLINPSQENVYGKLGAISQPNLGLVCIGTTLKQAGHKVRLIDIDFDKINYNDLNIIICNQGTHLVGLTSTTPTINNALLIAKLIKKTNSDIITVLGGIHATIETDYSNYQDIDYIVKGEGERAILKIIKELPTQKIIQEPLIYDLDSLPQIDRSLFNTNQYKYPDTIKEVVFPMVTSRGCFGRCTFCQSKNIFGLKMRFRSAQSVVNEIEYIVKNLKAKEIHIWDDNFAFHRERLFEIQKEMKWRGLKPLISFPNGLRIESALDLKVLRALKDIGTYSISFGIESGNQNVLDSVKKGITLNQVTEAINNSKYFGFEVWGFFILGFPEDSETTMQDTIDFAKSIPIDIAKFHILKPYPGSLIYEEMKRDNLIDDFDYDNYGIHTFPVHHTRHCSAQTVADYHKKAYREFYLRPKVIMNQIRLIKSWYRLREKVKYAFNIFR